MARAAQANCKAKNARKLIMGRNKPRPVCGCPAGYIKNYSKKFPLRFRYGTPRKLRKRPLKERNRLARFVRRSYPNGARVLETNPKRRRKNKYKISESFPFNRNLPQDYPPAGAPPPTDPRPYLYDGQGGIRGVVRSTSVKINFGQKMTINGKVCVYAFGLSYRSYEGTPPQPTGDFKPGSGWIELAAIRERYREVPEGPASMPAVNNPPPKNSRATYQACPVGEDPANKRSTDKIRNLKVVPCYNPKVDQTNMAVEDYLPRTPDEHSPAGYVNIVSALPGMGGVSTNTVPVGTTFYRLHPKINPKPVKIRVYGVGHGAPADDSMNWVYGFVIVPNGESPPRNRRYGWIAKNSLTCQSSTPFMPSSSIS
ncbi:MAG TPA: hypothetical protein VNA19_12880 [Pyrinomonadaceae bacterium]|jgi:hypothetical protein|nr:hypothetical protein [Pyrinomonadaceae bacterium]